MENTLELLLERIYKTNRSTIGKLHIDGNFFCYTLEDTDRGLKQSDNIVSIIAKKLFGITAIPAGRYEIALTYSNRFKKYMPQLLNVPGYQGIRIHIGNRPEETEGCILVGLEKGEEIDCIVKSRLAFEQLMGIFEKAQKDKKIYITIV